MYWSLLVQGKRTFLHPCLGWLENLSYRITDIDPEKEMTWPVYAKNLITFNLFGAFFLFLILIFQAYLPLNPQNFAGLSWDLALNTAISFMTNTNWQAYEGESTLSYTSQMSGLTVQNFLSAATGSAVLMAFIRGFVRKSSGTIGNFWADMVRSVIYLLLPLSIIFSLCLVGQGVVQTLSPYQTIETLEQGQQVIPLGPVASQIAIKQIGTNGGGFFNANSAHPFENPTALSNLFEILLVVAIPAAMVYSYGLLIGSLRHAFILLGSNFFLLLCGLAISLYSESMINPVLDANPVWEGKEVRIGNAQSVFWAMVTTVTSSGSVNTMHESLSPLTGGIALFNMMLGEVVFGGVGVGHSSLLIFVLMTVFLSGLMVGRTPEYKGKRFSKKDIQWIVVAISVPNILILLGAGMSCILPHGLASLSTLGPHGLTEMLYAFTSATMNNGSAFAGINANTSYLNLILAALMLLGRLAIIIPSLAIAGSFSAKQTSMESSGTLSTNSILFGILLISVILMVGGLTYLPALSLGPVVEQLLMLEGKAFPFLEGN
jgi:K+-transporting ATPase ATPase A chain